MRLCPECEHEFPDSLYGAIGCPDCLTPLFSRATGVTVRDVPKVPIVMQFNSTADVYLIDSREEVHILCPICGEDSLLSSTRRILVGYFRMIYVEITLDDGRKGLVEKRVPRTWMADACHDCQGKYDDLILHPPDPDHAPFLKI